MPAKMYNILKLIVELKAITKKDFDTVRGADGKLVKDDTGELVLVEKSISPTVFVQEDSVVCVSVEDGLGWADYYGEFTGGFPTIDPKLEKFAKDRGLNWQWQNAGVIALYN